MSAAELMIQLSPTALSEINRLRSKAPASGHILRLKINPGGCMDWSYGLSLCSEVTPNDQLMQYQDLQIVVDKASLERIDHLSIDYSEDLMGGGFRFHNAKASQTCGCGISFQC